MFSDILSMNHTMKRNIEARTENTRPYATTNRPATSPLTRQESRNFGLDLLFGCSRYYRWVVDDARAARHFMTTRAWHSGQ
jgi:hypothetical protein